MFLHDGFTAEGEVNLSDAAIGGGLNCIDGSFTDPGGHALNAERAQVTGRVVLGG